MASLFYPQLLSGALAQYPIRKIRLARTVKNILPDGSMILFSDPDGGRLLWELAYVDLADIDVQALQNHFSNCVGPFHAFTFIDPTGNMLVSSSNVTATPWLTPSLIQVTQGVADPFGGNNAFTVTNTGQSNLEITQTLEAPSGYQYCFSVYVMAANLSAITMIRRGSASENETSAPVGLAWSRVVSSGQLNDSGVGITIGISLAAGQQVQIYGPQLEPQIVPSRYRATEQTGGVYANAHWAVDQLNISATAPSLYSTAFSIETSV